MNKTPLYTLAHYIAEAKLKPDNDTLTTVRNGIIDTLGCILVGSKTEIATKSRIAVQKMSGAGASPVIGTDFNTARPQAAFLNAIAGHALDFDDWEIPGNTHPTVVMFPAILACANHDTSGEEIVKAYLAGFEIIARLGEALNFEHYDRGWHSTATLGAIGAAGAVSRLLKLNTDETANALSISISSASGYTCQFGSHAKPIQAGFAARTGVEAALLAQTGLTGQAHILDHPRGFNALTAQVKAERLEEISNKLGSTLALEEYGLVLKPWPSCGYTHRLMTCALNLREKLAGRKIISIDAYLPDFHSAVLPFLKPTNRSEALFSIPFVVAMGLLKGNLTLADMEGPIWEQNDIAMLINCCKVHSYKPKRPDLNYSEDDPDRLIVKLEDGSILESQCVYPIGAPQNPMSAEQLMDKFRSNSASSNATWINQLKDWPASKNCLQLFTQQDLQDE